MTSGRKDKIVQQEPFGTAYKQIYLEHHAEVPVKYRVSASGKETFHNLEKVDIDIPKDLTRVSTQDDTVKSSPSRRNNNVLQ